MSESFKSEAEESAEGGATLSADSAIDAVAHRFSFHGSVREYFKIWVVNVLLSVLTLGIYSAWAKVRNKRYFYTNTFLDGANFDYHARPLVILASRIMVIVVVALAQYILSPEFYGDEFGIALILFLFLFLPWAWVRGLSFNARNSSYRNVRFGFRRAYGMPYLLSGMVPLCAGLLFFGGFFIILYFAYFYLDGEVPFITEGLSGRHYRLARSTEIVGFVLSCWGFLTIFFIGAWLLRSYHFFKVGQHQLGVRHFSFNNPAIRFYVLAILCFVLWSFTFHWATFLLPEMPEKEVREIFKIKLLLLIFVSAAFCALFIPLAQAKSFRLLWDNVRLEGGAMMRCQFSTLSFYRILMVNYFAILFSLGLLIPWARVRKAKFLSENMIVYAPPMFFDSIIDKRGEEDSALGEEMDTSQGFDFDVGII